jgi:hypothetical protein
MVASLLRMLHSGAQDSRLLPIKGQPSAAAFTTVFRRAGRFTTHWQRLDFDYRPLLGQQATMTLPRKGHLISRLYLVTTLPDIKQYAAAAEAAPIPVSFTIDVGLNIDVSGNTYTKNEEGSFLYDTSITSVEKYTVPCFMEFSLPAPTKRIRTTLSFFSYLNGNPSNQSCYGLDFDSGDPSIIALTQNIADNPAYKIISPYWSFNAVQGFPLLSSDIFKIEFDGTNFNIYRNGVLSVVMSAPYAGTPLNLQVDFSEPGGSITLLNFGVPSVFAGPIFNYTNNLGHALIQQASIDIAGSRIENLDGQLLEVLDEFYSPLEKTTLMNKLLKRADNGFSLDTVPAGAPTVVTPLPFWFSCGDAGVALPIDAIQADPVKLNIQFSPITNLYISSARQAYTPSSGVAAGAAYFPLLGSQFYRTTPLGTDLSGILGDPEIATTVLPIKGVQVPQRLDLGDTYILAEYIYLDKPEANRFRISDIQVPIVQHYKFTPFDTRAFARIQMPLRIPNPTRNIFFFAQRYDATALNAPFLATRDLSGTGTTVPWWPDASGLNPYFITHLNPAFSKRASEPIAGAALVYEGQFVRYRTDAPVIFRSLLPSREMRKSPWVNRYYYALPFGYDQGHVQPSLPTGEANLDMMRDIYLNLTMHPRTGSVDKNDVDGFVIYVWAETYNILRVYGGRAGLMFSY